MPGPFNSKESQTEFKRILAIIKAGGLAIEYGHLALRTVRELMIEGDVHPKYGKQESLCRGEIKMRIKRIRRMFKWAVENELVDAKVLTALQSVAPLKT